MADKMLIDASHEEETRVVVVRGNRIEEFDFESQHKKQIRGNIYLAKVTRVEPSLQAAFVDYGGNRHGFLAFAEIHPDYYQIPLADRQALLQAEAEEHGAEGDFDTRTDLAGSDQPVIADPAEFANEAEEVAGLAATLGVKSEEASNAAAEAVTEEAKDGAAPEEAAVAKTVDADSKTDVSEPVKPKPRRARKPRKKAGDSAEAESAVQATADQGADQEAQTQTAADATPDDDDTGRNGSMAAMVDTDSITEETGRNRHDDDDDDDDDDGEKEEIESVGAEDAMEEVPDRPRRAPRKQYRIQEVIKRRQILLVQVAKEERGNKGAALTTYLSLAGRYSVLMPNTARGGGISRKITNPTDRKRLKEIARELDVPQGMGVILRTAGANRTKVEIKRDFEYLMRLWENVRTLTLNSTAPCLVYEEGSLIKRSIRDLYNKDINEIIVAGEDGYREAKDFMKMLMPSHAKVVQPYRDIHPIFSRSGIEAQLDRMLQPQVTLKSGGYIIINQTEALVAIDVNSGRSTREHSIEDTALQTNLEAAEEVARQLRLRDLAGLIVIDFIDMEEKRNNRSVEKKLKDCLKNDRARIQVGRISHFGLLEMSRQRIRASVLESTTQTCPHCSGTGLIRSQSSVALHVLRGIEEFLLKSTTHDITVRTLPETALYLLNHKRSTIVDYEQRFGVAIVIEADASVGHQHFAIERGEAVANPVKIESLLPLFPEVEEDDPVIEIEEDEEEIVAEATAQPQNGTGAGDDNGNRKRKRRRRRRGKNGNGQQDGATNGAQSEFEGDEDEDEADDAEGDASDDTDTPANAEASDEDGNGANQRRKRRRRGKRGGRRGRDENGSDMAADADNAGDSDASDDNEAAETSTAEGESTVEAVESVTTAAEDETAPAETATPSPRPRRARRTRASAEAETVANDQQDALEAAAETVAEAATPAPASEPVTPAVEPASETAKTPVTETEAPQQPEASTEADVSGEAEKPVRANRESTVTVSEPVVTSNTSSGDEAPKPKKGGWWQKRGFL
ncbi:Rne/Rng family ribonuclease [Allorhizobium sp. BGMRC 0089]|uniref:Rne/Rng family ribonuclease n=1 Tax=Allorhizobium sonneratiae TaxID=2934936 RepID=UPI002033EC42|nr:Rne/Rng family ribonuclease [Allorhizobium sonneratiae]MCM2294312.1 Rne/Rng family ribonuclease [Allorhizobium sonneratiae]